MTRKPSIPPDVQLHISATIRGTDWDAIAAKTGDLCAGCPAQGSTDDPDPEAVPPCYQCPLWAYRLDLTQLRLLRRLELGRSTSDKA